jgi:hypothetical protein
MRFIALFLVSALFIAPALPAFAADPRTDPQYVERQLYDVLRELHNRGADLYDTGDRAGSYRMFQATLLTARALLAHRPEDQKFIDDGMDAAEKMSTIGSKAYSLHEVIDNLRKRIKPKAASEELSIPPREAKATTVPPKEIKVEAPKEKEFKPPLDGMGGTVYWKGQALADAELMFVSRDRAVPQIYEAKTDAEGRFTMRLMRPGKYTVLLEHSRNIKAVLPERYKTVQTSPLIIEVAGKGEVINLMLQ